MTFENFFGQAPVQTVVATGLLYSNGVARGRGAKVCCSVLQRVVVVCTVSHCVAVCCSVVAVWLQCGCSVLQCVARVAVWLQ